MAKQGRGMAPAGAIAGKQPELIGWAMTRPAETASPGLSGPSAGANWLVLTHRLVQSLAVVLDQ